MAGPNSEQLLLDIVIRSNQEEIKKLAQVLADNKKAADELNKSFAAGRISAEALKQEQGRLAQSTKQAEQSMGVLTKVVQAQEAANKAATVSTEQLKGGFSTLVDKALAPFQSQLDKATGLLGKFKSGNDLVKQGLAGLQGAGETGALGFKALASGIALTGLGIFLILLGAVVTYFTNTAEGGKQLKQVLAGVGAVVNILTGAVAAFGKGIIEAVTHPLDSIKAIGEAIKENLINRFTAFSVILDGIKSGNFTKINDGIIQAGTGISNASEKAQKLAQGFADTAKAAAAAADQARRVEEENQRLVKVRRDVELLEKKEQGQLEVLLRLSRDQNLTHEQRKQKLQEAGEIERKASERILDLNGRELVQLERKLSLANGTNEASQLKADIAAKELEIQDKKNERDSINAKIRVRESAQDVGLRAEAAADRKAKAAEAAKLEQDAIKRHITNTELALLNTKAGTQQELELREKLVAQQAQLEAAGEKKTAADRQLILAKSLVEQLKLEEEFRAKRAEAAEKERDRIDSEYARARSAELKREADAKKEKEDNFKVDEALVERTLSRQRTAIENSYAAGEIDKKEYDSRIYAQDQASYGARAILAQHYGKDTSKLEEAQAKAHAAHNEQLTAEDEKAYEAKLEIAEQFGAEVGKLFVDTLNETGGSLQEFAGKVLVLVLDSLEKVVLAEQAKALVAGIAKGPLGLIEAGLEFAAITVAFESAKAVITAGSAKPFGANSGAIVPGPAGSPNRDSTLMYLTPGEAVMTRDAVVNFGPLLGHLNALGGGVNFAPGFSPRMAQQVDGGLTARAIGPAYNGPTAAEIGREVARNVPTEIGFKSWVLAKDAYYRGRDLATSATGSQKPSAKLSL
ncbi:MAG: hypothetical protein ACRYFX_10020 [Janthinobacterium lividum]